MKLFSVFMAIIVAGLSLMPCCDAVESKTTQSIISQSSDCCDNDGCKDESNSSENKACNGICSPFFTCGTCAGVTMQYAGYSLSSPFPLISKTVLSPLDEQFNSEYFNTQWQPPKIS